MGVWVSVRAEGVGFEPTRSMLLAVYKALAASSHPTPPTCAFGPFSLLTGPTAD
jgi:hypothetical protein